MDKNELVECEGCGKQMDKDSAIQDAHCDDIFFCESCYNKIADELEESDW